MYEIADELHSRFYQELPSDIDYEMSELLINTKKVLEKYAD